MGFGQLCAFHFGKDVRALDLPVICRHPSMILCSVTNLELSVIYQISPRQSQQSGIQTKQRPFQTFLKINCFSNFSCNPTHIFADSIQIGRIHSVVRTISANATGVVKPLEIIANLVKRKNKKQERIHGTVRIIFAAIDFSGKPLHCTANVAGVVKPLKTLQILGSVRIKSTIVGSIGW